MILVPQRRTQPALRYATSLAALAAAMLVGGCGVDQNAGVATGQGSPTIAGPVRSPAPAPTPGGMDIARFYGLLARNGDVQVLQRNGLTQDRITELFRRACDEIRRGRSPGEVFVRYRDAAAAGQQGQESETVANALADAWGAGIPTFCPDVAGR